MSFDVVMLQSLHIERLRHGDLVPGDREHPLFQTSTFDALLHGRYEGDVTLGELLAQGDLGLGTFDQLDGEMTVLDGHCWRTDGEGRMSEPPLDWRTPFAVVVPFAGGEPVAVPALDGVAALQAWLDAVVPDPGAIWALRLDGWFDHVTTRSVAAQQPPYRELAAVLAAAPQFSRRAVGGTLVGFRYPSYAQGVGVAGYHLHFLADDRTFGGHLVDLALLSGQVRADERLLVHLETPPGVRLPEPGAIDDALVRAIEHQD